MDIPGWDIHISQKAEGLKMGRPMLKKAAAAAAAGAVLILGAAGAMNHLSKNRDTYRSILIYQLEGAAGIDREGTGRINAVENLHLESGDTVTVESGSFMRLRLDDDKYAMVEEDSVLSVEAAGEKTDSRTRIRLIQGTVVNEIQNPLSAGSLYEVTTPNSIMAVRGTVFRVEVFFDSQGDAYTKLSVFEGNVASRLVFPDGTMDEEISVEAGSQVIIHSSSQVTEYLEEGEDNPYEDLSLQTLYLLQDMTEQGKEVPGITRQELEELIRRLEEGENTGAGRSGGFSGTEPGIGREDPVSQSWREPENAGKEWEASEQSESPALEKPETSQTSPAAERSETSQDSSLPENPGNPETETSPAGTSESQTAPDASGESQKNPTGETSRGGGSGGGTGTSGEIRNPSTAAPVCTVTFWYGEEEFASQQVERGSRAARPRLQPARTGSWDWDFDTPVTEDTEIFWQ